MTAYGVARPGFLKRNFAFFWKTTPYGNIFKILFREFTWQHGLTLLCANVVKFVRREISEIVRYLILPDKKHISTPSEFPKPLLRRYCADRAQNLPGPTGKPPTFGSQSQRSKFHPNRFTLSERVKAVFGP